MNDQIEQLMRELGQHALSLAPDLAGKLLVYAEVESGAISAYLFWVSAPSAPLRFRFCPKPMQSVIYSLWTEWQKHPPHHEWRTMSYIIENGKFKVDYVYPDQINEEESEVERRPRVVKQHFGDTKIDYSSPKG